MRNTLIAVMLVAAGASSSYLPLGGDVASGSSRATATKKEISKETDLKHPIDDPYSLLADFLDPNSKEPRKLDGGVPPVKNPLNLRFLIATIPDPERTHLGLYFDRYLEAMLLAAEDEDYVFDRYWLPWKVESEPQNADPRKQDILDSRSVERHQQPGILIMRSGAPDKHDDALVVFVVGGTPTSGVDRHQFDAAIRYINSYESTDHRRFDGVLGPVFSGSVSSL